MIIDVRNIKNVNFQLRYEYEENKKAANLTADLSNVKDDKIYSIYLQEDGAKTEVLYSSCKYGQVNGLLILPVARVTDKDGKVIAYIEFSVMSDYEK